jgi:hypothetical protein
LQLAEFGFGIAPDVQNAQDSQLDIRRLVDDDVLAHTMATNVSPVVQAGTSKRGKPHELSKASSRMRLEVGRCT